MRKPFDRVIGELCRNGKPVFYAFIDGEEVQTDTRDELVRKLYRRATERRLSGLSNAGKVHPR